MKKASVHRRATRSRRRFVTGAGGAAEANAEHRRAAAAFEATTRTDAETARLIGQIREANERLIVSAVRSQSLSDEAREETAQARADFDRLMSELDDAQRRLRVAARKANAMTVDARQREADYQRLSSRLLQLQDEERKRLALDLHDSTAQYLAALTMSLDQINAAKDVLDARSRRALAQSRALADQCSREVRTLAYLLHPPLLDEAGLLAAVRWYVAGFIERCGIRVNVDVSEVGRLPGPIETALFRVVQEGLTNIHRHASSSTASIRLTSTAGAVVLDIEDQGRGLRDRSSLGPGTRLPEILGVGVRGMRERIHQLGGTFDIRFTDSGTTVHVVVPLRGGLRDASAHPHRR